MKSFIIPALLAASVSLLLANHADAQPSKKGEAPPAAPAETGVAEGPVVVLKDLTPGTAVRVKYQNEWVDGKVVRVQGSQLQVQLGRGNKEWFDSEKLWGTEEQRDNTAAGGYIDTFVRANFEKFKVAVAEAEAVKKSGADAQTVRAAVEKAEQILKADYGKAARHPRIGPFLVRYWAMATSKVDELAAEAVAEAEKAAASSGTSYFTNPTRVALSRAEAVRNEYTAFQTTPNAETERLDKVLADAAATIDAARTRFMAKVLEAARVPPEIYKGSDAKALKAKVTAEWKKQHPDKPILKLVISTQWDHERTWKTNNSSAGGYWYDWTTIYMDLAVKKDATTATVYPVGLSFPDGNKKKMVVSASDLGYGNYSPFDMLLKNVK